MSFVALSVPVCWMLENKTTCSGMNGNTGYGLMSSFAANCSSKCFAMSHQQTVDSDKQKNVLAIVDGFMVR